MGEDLPSEQPPQRKASVRHDDEEFSSNEFIRYAQSARTRKQMAAAAIDSSLVSELSMSLCTQPSPEAHGVQTPEPVTLNIYNLGGSSCSRSLNALLKPFGTGAFHCGVQVYDREWSFSDTSTGEGDGVFPVVPGSVKVMLTANLFTWAKFTCHRGTS